MFSKYLMGLLIAGSLCVSEKSQAYFVATEPATLKANLPTDVFIAGFGNEQGEQFLKSAILAAKVSKDRFSQRQRIIISAVNESLAGGQSLLTSGGFSIRKADQEELKKSNLAGILKSFSVPVTSLQFFGHANTYNGFRLQSKTDRLDQTDKEFAQVGKVLAPNAFVVFHSCNSGWLLAPAAAKAWNRPVFGSFASSDFQELMSDGQWYYHDVGMYPDNLKRIGRTNMITQESQPCTSHNCMRLKPTNVPYVDDFGTFTRGLGFYKVFAVDEKQIPQAMIHMTLLTPTVTPLNLQSSRQDLIKAVKDWMCPSDKSGTKRQACSQAIDNKAYESNRTLSFFSGKAVACNNMTCSTVAKCSVFKAIFGAVPCKTKDLDDAPSTVFSDQMKMIMKGLELFEQGKLNL